jgi:hypothetical protein
MISIARLATVQAVLFVSFSGCLGIIAAPAQQLDNAAVVRNIDAAVHARLEHIARYTATEHYAIFRNKDEIHPVAEMTVKTDYRKESGKSYTILSQSGSSMIQKLVLGPILDNEKQINEPGVREGSWITSANYEMKLKPGGAQQIDGRDCLALALTPRRKAPYLLEGTIRGWPPKVLPSSPDPPRCFAITQWWTAMRKPPTPGGSRTAFSSERQS